MYGPESGTSTYRQRLLNNLCPYGSHGSFQFLFLGEVRLDAILIHGVDNMSTKDVFAYFSDFAPGSVEWIDDSSCKLFQHSQIFYSKQKCDQNICNLS